MYGEGFQVGKIWGGGTFQDAENFIHPCIWVIKVICKNTIYFFWPLRGPTGATKLRDFDKFALDKDTLNGCNFFVFEDN